ncbi:protein-disulfide reductase DsbD family protein [Massilia yuzhufengensis]|uniref:Thiol:disulfide interchange protein DsbD n=1 Tax=Massilia yuzhufengensis TaxID=1164594 RepID=A0A1I1PY40_9BURK|nr:thioredoxin family protein [Massilia yuzhufengensis]SFD14675.1 thiol:disulfide interchange protein DsbD [Massilia yuzhufengensis]
MHARPPAAGARTLSLSGAILRIALAFLLVFHAALGHAASSAVTGHARVELLVHAPAGVKPGAQVWLGLRLQHAPRWHTYWRNAGDSGLPTTFAWTLPPGFTAGDIVWPTPKQLPLGPLMNYGYDGDLLLPVRLTVPAGYQGGALPVKLRADWLICEEVCIPEFAELDTMLAAGPVTAHAALFERARAAAPLAVPGLAASARIEGKALVIDASGLPPGYRGQPLQLFPENGGVIDHPAALVQQWDGDRLVLRAPLSAQRSDSPATMGAVLTAGHASPGIRFEFPIAGPWPQPGAANAPAAAQPAPAMPGPEPGRPWLLVLALAFVGGAILNLMPCVFPILSLKVLGFAQHLGERRRVVAGGLAYTAGVIASFLLLAALLLALRAGGEQLGWGFQLQSPLFVAALAMLFTLIGFNLAGLVEFNRLLPASFLNARARNPVADDFLTGVLAVAVASPCTAPFMGAALGAALAQPAPQALSVFAALGAGMAAPYLAASLFPGVARIFPRPGPWMARFKTVMAFPMFATVVWLLWVLGLQAGVDAVAALLGLLLAAAFGLWVLGLPARSSAGRWAGIGVAAMVVGGTAAWSWPALRHAQAPIDSVASAGAFQAWSPQLQASARAEGRPVFVDFTAAWCVTCQYNKRTTFADPGLLRDFGAKNVLLLRADWTRRDATITQALKELGRSGVPVYVLYRIDARQPTLLSELPSVEEVRRALAGL